MADLILQDIGQSHGDVTVLSGLNLHIRSGEFVVFVGPSGCGKSTLLRMIAGLDPIGSGTLLIDGQRMNATPPGQRGVAMVFQSYALYPHMTVRENLAFALRVAGKSRADIAASVARAAQMLELGDCLDRLPRALSGGQRQRVAIGRAIVRDPRIWLFDEPLSNLDASLRVAMRVEIAQLKAAMPDRTMIYVTHDQTEAMTLADRIVVMAGGTIAQVGAPLELYERPATEFVARFIGSPAMNLLPGRITATGQMTAVSLADGAALAAIPTRSGDADMPVNLGIRPEGLRPTDGPAICTGTVTLAEGLGDVTVLHLTTPQGSRVTVKLPGTHRAMIGQTLRLTADPGALHLFHDGKSLPHRPAP